LRDLLASGIADFPHDAEKSRPGGGREDPPMTTRTKARKDPEGGLTEAGREHYRKTEGADLKPGVKKRLGDMTPEEMKRKGSFLRRHFATLRGPLRDEDGKPTRLALQAHAWGEPVPKTPESAKKLAEKGTRLLERYRKEKDKAARKSED
jgi:hypothetical protein